MTKKEFMEEMGNLMDNACVAKQRMEEILNLASKLDGLLSLEQRERIHMACADMSEMLEFSESVLEQMNTDN